MFEFDLTKPAETVKVKVISARWMEETTTTTDPNDPEKEITETKYFVHVLCDGKDRNQKLEVSKHEYDTQEGLWKNNLEVQKNVKNVQKVTLETISK